VIKLMFICNDAEMARYAVECGVDRIFVDLEIHGKWERQGHRDTLISGHSMQDVARVRAAIPDSELLVRLNPLHDGSAEEVEQAVSAGADLLMLPMFETAEQVKQFVALVRGRAKVVPLVETPASLKNFAEIMGVPGIDEIYIGLNDLHLALGLDFMFELLADGTVEGIAKLCRAADKPFGFGGIARMEEGLLPGDLVLAEHIRLGSSSVILSRTFHRTSASLGEMHANLDFKREIARLREYERQLIKRDAETIEFDHQRLLSSVADDVANVCAGRAR